MYRKWGPSIPEQGTVSLPEMINKCMSMYKPSLSSHLCEGRAQEGEGGISPDVCLSFGVYRLADLNTSRAVLTACEVFRSASLSFAGWKPLV